MNFSDDDTVNIKMLIMLGCLLLLLLLLSLKKVGNAWPEEGDCHPISRKTPAPQYQPTERQKRKGKTVEDKKGTSNVGQYKSIDLALKTHQSHTI